MGDVNAVDMKDQKLEEAKQVPVKYTHSPQPVMPVLNDGDSPMVIIGKMAMSGISLDILDKMMELKERQEDKEAKSLFDKSLSKAKGRFKKAKKSGYNTHSKKNYSLLSDMEDATKDALAENGLAWRHIVKNFEDGNIKVTCVLTHEGGHREESELTYPAASMQNKMVNALQSMGIVKTYLQRLTLGTSLGIVSDEDADNDGQGGKAHELPPFPTANKAIMNRAVDAYRRDANLDSIKNHYTLTHADESAIVQASIDQAHENIKKVDSESQ